MWGNFVSCDFCYSPRQQTSYMCTQLPMGTRHTTGSLRKCLYCGVGNARIQNCPACKVYLTLIKAIWYTHVEVVGEWLWCIPGSSSTVPQLESLANASHVLYILDRVLNHLQRNPMQCRRKQQSCMHTHSGQDAQSPSKEPYNKARYLKVSTHNPLCVCVYTLIQILY